MAAADRPPFIADQELRFLKETADPRPFLHPRFFRRRYQPNPDKASTSPDEASPWAPVDRRLVLDWCRSGAAPARLVLAADPGTGITTNLRWLQARLNAPRSDTIAFLIEAVALPENLDDLLSTTLVAQLRRALGNDILSLPWIMNRRPILKRRLDV